MPTSVLGLRDLGCKTRKPASFPYCWSQNRTSNRIFAGVWKAWRLGGVCFGRRDLRKNGVTVCQAASASERGHTKLREYVDLLRRNSEYRSLFISENVSGLGNCLSLLASIELCKSLLGTSGLWVSLIYVSRQLPYLVLFPVTGAMADVFDRGRLMLSSYCLMGTACLMLPFVKQPSHVGWMYGSIFFQCVVNSVFDPAKRAIKTDIVRQQDLHLQGTLDSMCWALTSAIGCSFAGWLVSKYGTTICFQLDALTFVAAGFFIRRLVNRPSSIPKDDSTSSAPTHAAKPTTDNEDNSRMSDWEATLVNGVRDTSKALADGWKFVSAPDKAHLMGLATIKACGAMVWGPGDVINAGIANMPQMQAFGGSAATLGLIMGTVGVGCTLGPLLFNRFCLPKASSWIRAVILTFVLQCGSYFILAFAPNIWTVLLGSFIRSVGSSTCWTYSTLLLQATVERRMLGRMLSLDVGIAFGAEAISTFLMGSVIHWAKISTPMACTLNAAVAFVFIIRWVIYSNANCTKLEEQALYKARQL